MKVEQARLDRILGVYKPDWRYLKEADLVSPRVMEGLFEIPHSGYIDDTGHFNAVELLICYNQLAYTFLDEASLRGHIDENSSQLDIAELRRMQQKCFIASLDKMKFREIIDPKRFPGRIELHQVRKAGDFGTFYKTSYDFGNGSATGEVVLVKRR